MQEILDKIIKECPKAWGEFINKELFANSKCIKHFINGRTIHITLEEESEHEKSNVVINYNFRNFYDCFDGLGVVVTTDYLQTDIKKYACVVCRNGAYQKTDWFITRTEAEWNAFYEAFKIREQQL